MANIFGWIGMREEREVLDRVREHVTKVREVVRLLRDVVEAAWRGDTEEVKRLHEQLGDREHEADQIRRRLLSSLSEGMLLPPDRHDLVHLIERIDHVADAAHGASRMLVLFEGFVPEAEVAKGLLEMAELLIKTADSLGEAMESLYSGSVKETLEKCTRVEEYEEECDHLKAALLRMIFNLDLTPARLLLLHDVIECMEDTADKAEDTCDVIRNLAVKVRR